MPKVSKERGATVEDRGPFGVDRHADLDGYTVNIVSLRDQDTDLTPLLKGLPDDRCPCAHWGYVLKGRMWFRFDGREESYEAGDAFYAPPGHTSGADAHSEFVVFSPTDQLAEVDAVMARNAQAMMQGA